MTASRIAVAACLAVAFGCAEPQDAVPAGDGDDGGDAADDGRPDRSDADDGGDTADDAEEAPEAADGDAEDGDAGDASPGILGDPCVRHADCLVGYCVESPEGDRVCSGTCAGSCPAPYGHWECRAMRTGGASIVMLCLPPNDLLCAACFRDDQCGSVRALCLDYPIGRFCGRDCAAEECPFGFDCLDVVVRGEVHRQCRPFGGNCADCVDRDGDLRGAGVDCLGPDCDDADPLRHDGAAEVVDSIDNDCDGLTDEGTPVYDDDDDGFCEVGPCVHGALGDGDCNDGEASINPGATELRNGIDDDCDGAVDDGTTAYDDDGDGYCEVGPCVRGALGEGDCDDSNSRIHPGAPEDGGTGTGAPDGRDNDCDGATDEGTTAYDDDGDGFCEVAPCVNAPAGGDCDDANPLRSPGRAEVVDGLDNDCDGLVDEGTPVYDDDGDGFCEIAPCVNAPLGGDCDDADGRVHPGAPEDGGTGTGAPDGRDNDCDGATDEGTTAYDDDGDGFCEVGPCLGAGILPGDCADANPARNPGRLEVCGNGVDDDCDGTTDQVDNDGDGAQDIACGGNDCDDTDPSVRPGRPEIRDAKDNNCDGRYDEGLVQAGDVVVTEIMHDPAGGLIDANAEWFEVRNVSAFPINLQGWVIRDLNPTPDMHTINRPGGLRVDPGGVVLLARNGDTAVNGDIRPDYVYSGVALANVSDEVILLFGPLEVDRVVYGGGWPLVEGASLNLGAPLTTATANDLPANWCAAPLAFAYHTTNRGTPGAVNVDCAGGPAVGEVVPRRGLAAGGEPVRIVGNRFAGATAVTIGGAAAPFSVVDDRTIRATTPPGTPGPADVRVTTTAGSFTLVAGYVYTGAASTLDFCNVQHPESTTTSVGAPTVPIFGRVREAGVTPPAGQGIGIVGEVGHGPRGSDPRTTIAWTWVAARYYLDVGSDDAYGASITAAAAGTYSYAYRFNDDGGVHWLYCDVGAGTDDGFSTANLGLLTVL